MRSARAESPTVLPASTATTAQPAPPATATAPAAPTANSEGAPLSALPSAELVFPAIATVDAPVDLWDRIRRGYSMADLDNDHVRSREVWYAKRPDYLGRISDRGQKYLFHIVEELEMRKMPTELALLPFIESAFVTHAVSSAKAAGMWQFMPGTGKDFNLKQNLFRDDRRDVLQSTRAALDYLQRLYNMFGDWHLALAAYNWGQGNVQRAMAKNQKAGLSTAYWDLSLPNETRDYIPKLQAVKNIVSDPARFSIKLPAVDNHPFFQTVNINRDIDVELAARLAEVKVDDFVALNPSANKPVILAAGTPQILLPWDNAAVFVANLAKHTGRLASWTAWTVPAQMRPDEAAKRTGMSEAQLRAVNRIPPRHSIRAGSTLLVPRGANGHDVAASLADTAQLALAADPRKVCRTVKAKGKPAKQVCKMVVPSAKAEVKKGSKAAQKASAKGKAKATAKQAPAKSVKK